MNCNLAICTKKGKDMFYSERGFKGKKREDSQAKLVSGKGKRVSLHDL